MASTIRRGKAWCRYADFRASWFLAGGLRGGQLERGEERLDLIVGQVGGAAHRDDLVKAIIDDIDARGKPRGFGGFAGTAKLTMRFEGGRAAERRRCNPARWRRRLTFGTAHADVAQQSVT